MWSSPLPKNIYNLFGKSPAIVNIMRTVCTTSMYPGSQAEWTGMHMHEQRVLCGQHIVKDWAREKQICIKLSVELEHYSTETIWMIQKATAMGNWWLAASSQSQHHTGSCISCRILGETSNHPGYSDPLQPRFGTLWLLASPKIKITFEREEISEHWWDSGKYNGVADGD